MRVNPFLPAAVLAIMFCGCDSVKPPVDNGGDGGDTGKAIFLGSPPVFINEVYSANAGLSDEFGDDPGWVEFYNPADTSVNLNGYWLTNNVNRRQWAFGNVVVEPRGYLLVFLSGRDKPDLEPARDSIDLIRNTVGAWSWADSQLDPPQSARPGGSTARQTFASGRITGALTAADNTGTGGLGWSTAEVVMKLHAWGDASVLDISRVNQILIRGQINKGARLQVGLIQPDKESWLGWSTVLRGTGVENDLYVIELPPEGSGFPDLANISGIRLSNVANNFGTIDFTFTSMTARRRASNVHASFELGSRSGNLFLMDSDGHIRDTVSYPASTLGLSYAKSADGGAWALSKPPTPYAANSSETYTGQVQPPSSEGIPKSGHYEDALTFTLPRVNDEITICCDTTGRMPSAGSELRSGAALTLTRTTVMRCAQFMAGAHPSGPIMRTYIIGERLPSLPVVSIAVDPYDMFDETDGLYSLGPNASPNMPNFGANFWRDTELPIQMEFFEGGAQQVWSHPAGLQIFGNYSRMQNKKSVAIYFREEYGQNALNYGLLPEHPHLTRFKRFILRNNGNNYGLDYIRDMMLTSLTEGLGIDYQKGRSVIVYYNGRYFGIHNLRERSNAHYFKTNYGMNRELIDLVKGNNEISNGSDDDYQDIYRWVGSVTLDDENLRLLGERIDIDNFTNYFQAQIYFANRDWPGNNLKRWRLSSPPTKWKWFMYDTDYSFDYPYDANRGLKMLEFATNPSGPDWPNPPHSTLMLRKLLQNENYKNAFINRFSLLLATYYAPARVEARIDALMAAIASEVPLDQSRWRLNASSMNNHLNSIKTYGRNRASQMQQEIEEFFGLRGAVDVAVSAAGSGDVLIDNLPVLNGSAAFKAYPSVPITVKAVPNPGAVFEGWSDGVADAQRVVNVGGPVTLEARFGPASF